MILLIDNYDSFSYNLVQLIESLGKTVFVVKNDEISCSEIENMKPEKVVISPGPKTPAFAGVSSDVIKKFYKTIPILGVCLGHQCLGEVFGANVVNATTLMHGKTSLVFHNKTDIFSGVPTPVKMARYHSLVLENIKSPLMVTARTKDGTIMAVRHKNYSVYGLQFHPESFMSRHGRKILKNFLS